MVTAWEGLSPPYRTILVDPPWRYASAATKADARKHYSTASTEELREMPVADLADADAHLWLWCTNALMGDGYGIVRAWGFSPLTVVTWCKPGPGVGHYLRNNTEHLILASRGRPMVPETKPISTWHIWQRGAHSAKPAASYDLIEQVSPSPRVELFARQQRFAWDSWGLGVEAVAS